MAIKTYDDFYNFFGDYPRVENFVYTESQNSLNKPGYRGKGYQVIIEPEEWDILYLKSCMSVIFKSLSGQWNPQGNDWIVGLIIQEIAKSRTTLVVEELTKKRNYINNGIKKFT